MSRWNTDADSRDDDPDLAEVRRLALALPGAREKVSHGRPAFYTAEGFAYFGGSLKRDGLWVEHSRAIVVLPDPGEREALLHDARSSVPSPLGPAGWVGLEPAEPDPDWQEVAEVLDDSFRRTTPRRLVAELDTAGPGRR